MGSLTGKKVLAVVTGASRGIGRQLVLDVAEKAAPGSAILITARNENALLEVKQEIRTRNADASVWIVVCDMADLNDEAKRTFDEIMREITEKDSYESFFLFHNAGFLGDVSRKALKLNDTNDWTHFLSANFVSMVLFNNIMLKWITHLVCKHRFIINMSSILAIQAFPSFTQHACGKAAREAFFRGLAVEEPTLRVLNYAPGPVLTDMYRIVQEKSYDSAVRNAYTVTENGNGHANGTANGHTAHAVHLKQLSPEQTTSKLLRILNDDTFTSGDHIDYFDDEPEDVKKEHGAE